MKKKKEETINPYVVEDMSNAVYENTKEMKKIHTDSNYSDRKNFILAVVCCISVASVITSVICVVMLFRNSGCSDKMASSQTQLISDLDVFKSKNIELKKVIDGTSAELKNLSLRIESETNGMKVQLNQSMIYLNTLFDGMEGRINRSELELNEIFSPIRCYMGMKSGEISDSQLSASSSYSAISLSADKARLDAVTVSGGARGGWASKPYPVSGEEWIQVDLGRSLSVAGVILQGLVDRDQWVKTYKVKCDSKTIQQSNADKVFIGSMDRSTKAVAKFLTPLKCRVIRIVPITWQVQIAIRFELIKGSCFDLI